MTELQAVQVYRKNELSSELPSDSEIKVQGCALWMKRVDDLMLMPWFLIKQTSFEQSSWRPGVFQEYSSPVGELNLTVAVGCVRRVRTKHTGNQQKIDFTVGGVVTRNRSAANKVNC